jgi:hypothetical protein
MRFFVSFLLLLSWANDKKSPDQRVNDIPASVIAKGYMPNLVTDKLGNVYLVYGLEDSIYYAESMDHGASFSTPVLVATVPELFASAMRGPQIAIARSAVVIIAADKAGNIYSYRKVNSGNWEKATRVNDVEAVAKEGLMALSGDGSTLFAVWLDLRGNKHNKIEGAKSNDGGKTWSMNKLIYASPDSTVCECCKPSVVVKDNHIYVMFRNWIRGNRDLYLTQSSDGGDHFNNAQKLGNGYWPLNGCPMDGGGLALDAGNNPQTVWRRQNKIFSCTPGKPEVEIGEGRSCSIASVNGMNLYAWCENDDIVCILPRAKKKILGKGILPLIKTISNNKAICVWEDAGRVCKAVLDL